ncbi:hypothetical protein T265_12436, partial [Opisthorchis viverrini]
IVSILYLWATCHRIPSKPISTIYFLIARLVANCTNISVQMVSVRLVRDRDTDAFKGYAYVDFEDETSFQTALKTDGSIVEGFRLRVNPAQEKRGSRGGPRGGPPRAMGNGYGRGGGGGAYQGRGNQDNWSSRGRPNMGPGGGRFTERGPRGGGGGMGGRGGPQRQSYHPPGLARDPIVNDRPDTGDLNSNSSGEERPRLKLKPRTVPLNQTDDRHLSERSKAIFGTGRPREPSPLREEAPTTSSYMGKRFYCDYCDKSFPDNATNRRAHLNGVQHQQARRLHFDRYLGRCPGVFETTFGTAPQEKLVLERAKKPCIGFARTGAFSACPVIHFTGECNYGVLCKYSHMTPEMLHQLEQQAKEKASDVLRLSYLSSEQNIEALLQKLESVVLKRRMERERFGSTSESHSLVLPVGFENADLPPSLLL